MDDLVRVIQNGEVVADEITFFSACDYFLDLDPDSFFTECYRKEISMMKQGHLSRRVRGKGTIRIEWSNGRG